MRGGGRGGGGVVITAKSGGGNSVGNAKCPSLFSVTCLIYYKSREVRRPDGLCCGNVATSCHFYNFFFLQVEVGRVKILQKHLNFVLIIVQAVIITR